MSYRFKNRLQAAVKLAEKLKKYRNVDGIVLAIPRGGVPVAYVISQQLELPLEVVLSKKIGHPNNPEFAIGSVSLQGVILDKRSIDVSKDYIERESERIKVDLKNKFKLFMGNRQVTDVKNKIVILVDDGIATGNTMIATIEFIKKNNPKKVIVAIPVSPADTCQKISNLVDEFVCLQTPRDFFGVGQFYDDFTQVTDSEVTEYLNQNKLAVNY